MQPLPQLAVAPLPSSPPYLPAITAATTFTAAKITQNIAFPSKEMGTEEGESPVHRVYFLANHRIALMIPSFTALLASLLTSGLRSP